MSSCFQTSFFCMRTILRFCSCSKCHNVGNLATLLYTSDIKCCINGGQRKLGGKWKTKPSSALEIGPREGCQDFSNQVVCAAKLANSHFKATVFNTLNAKQECF